MATNTEEMWQMLRELIASQKENEAGFKETRAMFKETDARFKETDAMLSAKFKETDAKFKETDAKFKETDAKFKETDAMLSAKFKETDEMLSARFKETDAQFKEIGRKLKEVGKQIGGIGERFGSFTEGLAYPSLRKILFKQYGIENTAANVVKDFPDGRQIEFDAFGYTNGTVNNAVVVEVKTHLQSKHIYEFKKELSDFRADFPEFKDKHLYGILATARVVSKELRQEIFANGLHLAIVHDEIFGFKNNPNAIDFNA